MKAIKLGILAFLASTSSHYGVLVVSVDMDLGTPGIQSTRVASPLDAFTVGIVAAPGPEGVSSYAISAMFDTAELSLNGSPAATEFQPLPSGFNFTPGVALEDNSTGRVFTFEAGTFAAGPTSGTFSIGTIAFTVPAVIVDGALDITLGFFNTGVDGASDNAGMAVTTTFVGGSVVPEPSTLGLLAAWSMGWFARRRRAV